MWFFRACISVKDRPGCVYRVAKGVRNVGLVADKADAEEAEHFHAGRVLDEKDGAAAHKGYAGHLSRLRRTGVYADGAGKGGAGVAVGGAVEREAAATTATTHTAVMTALGVEA